MFFRKKLYQAIETGDERAVVAALNKWNIKRQYKSIGVPLLAAIKGNQKPVVATILGKHQQWGATPVEGWKSMLESAVSVDSETVLDPLMVWAAWNLPPNLIHALLPAAARIPNLPLMEFLVEKGADINALSDGKSPLHSALFAEEIDAIRWLLENGADENLPMNDLGCGTPLHVVSFFSRSPTEGRTFLVQAIEVLLSYGADPNLKDEQGRVPLHNLSHTGWNGNWQSEIEAIKVLLDHGADLNAKNCMGWTPLDESRGLIGADPEVEAYLLGIGARSGFSPTSSRESSDPIAETGPNELEHSKLVSEDLIEGSFVLIEEKYPEINSLIQAGKERGFILHEDLFEKLPEELTGIAEALDEIYDRLNELQIDVLEGDSSDGSEKIAESGDGIDSTKPKKWANPTCEQPLIQKTKVNHKFEKRTELNTLMVSVLIRSKGIQSTLDFLRKQGFISLPSWTPLKVDLEIAGGYFSRMRGDHSSSNAAPSLFQPQPLLNIFDNLPMLARGEVVIAFGPWRDEKFRGKEKTPIKDSDGNVKGMLQMPEWRNVLYVLGPLEPLRTAIEELISHPGLPNGARGDLEIALRWWEAPVYPTGLAPVTVLRR